MPSHYKTLGVSGRGQFGSVSPVLDDTVLRGLAAAREYEKIFYDPTGRMMFLAITLPIRRVAWRVEPGGEQTPADVAAAEFMWSALNDMSQTWADVLSDVCRMFIYGYQVFWVVLKRRTERNSEEADGRVGFRKLEAVSQRAVIDWEFAEDGDIVGPVVLTSDFQQVVVPLAGSLYFRTDRAGDFEEGQSIYEAARRPWRFRRRLEQVEGVGLHRRWAGLPVVHLPDGATTFGTSGAEEVSDEQRAEELARAIYEDRMMGVVLPAGWSMEFGGPQGNVDATMGETIKRKDTEMARAIMAQFLLQGLMQVGTQALTETLFDAFLSAVETFLDAIRDEFNSYAVPLLLRHNEFPGLTGAPRLEHSSPRSVPLADVAQYLSVLLGHDLLSRDVSLEAFLRSLVPGMPTEVGADAVSDGGGGEGGGEGDVVQDTEGDEGDGVAAGFARRFRRLVREGQSRQFSQAQVYRDLAADHGAAQRAGLEEWAGDLGAELVDLGANATAQEVGGFLDEAVLLALLMFRERSVLDIGAAFWLGFGAPSGPPEALDALSRELETADAWMGFGRGGVLERVNPLGRPTLFGKIAGALEGQIAAILLLLKSGRDDEVFGLVSDTVSAASRGFHQAELYAGNVWHGVWSGVAARHALDPDSGPVRWVLDAHAEHCSECPIFGAPAPGRRYDSMDALLAFTGGVLPGYGTECDGNCRCHLTDDSGNWL